MESAQLGQWTLPGDTTAPARARHLARGATGHLHDDARGVLELLVSELVANAVVHGDGPVHVTLHAQGQVLRVAVHDTGSGLPRPAPASTSTEGGRGLHIVRALAEDWGSDVGGAGGPVGKTVWCTVRDAPLAVD
ncbi:ATP-binding protein [Phycicoccus avicenniae]|uniref:ATP-binding protein n=1 Tax=Phycicoccus avicenniae TaxID=2828860 RepID=UPI003D2C97DA